MPPTKQQIENLECMVAEIGLTSVVEMAIKSAAHYGVHRPTWGVVSDIQIRAIYRAQTAASLAADFIRKK